jgi:hypothetical protein
MYKVKYKNRKGNKKKEKNNNKKKRGKEKVFFIEMLLNHFTLVTF